jgi:cell division protein FtsL
MKWGKEKSMGKRILCLLLLLSVPLLLGLNVLQASKYTRLQQELSEKEAAQVEWVNKNKELITELSGLEAPARIETYAREKLGLRRAKPNEVLRVELENGRVDQVN